VVVAGTAGPVGRAATAASAAVQVTAVGTTADAVGPMAVTVAMLEPGAMPATVVPAVTAATVAMPRVGRSTTPGHSR
jgi:hypothetical protein